MQGRTFRKWNLVKALVALALGSGLAVLTHSLRGEVVRETPDRSYVGAVDGLRRAGYEFGMSLADLRLTGCDGHPVALRSVAAEKGAVLHFVDRSCDRCVRDLAEWSEAASLSKLPLIVIACNEASPLKGIDGFAGDCESLFTILAPAMADGPRAVPLTVVVNPEGVITGLIPSVKRLLAPAS